jgi:hypothetical protein
MFPINRYPISLHQEIQFVEIKPSYLPMQELLEIMRRVNNVPLEKPFGEYLL